MTSSRQYLLNIRKNAICLSVLILFTAGWVELAVTNSDIFGMAPLMKAIILRNNELAISLMDQGVNFDEIDEFGNNVLSCAIMNGNPDLFLRLINQGAELDQILLCRLSPLMKSIVLKKDEIAKLLIENGVNLDLVDYRGLCAMDFAIREKNLKIINYLIENGATLSPNMISKIVNMSNLTVLHREEFSAIIDLLIEATNLDLNAHDFFGRTALHHAIQNNSTKMIEYLISKGVNLDAVNDLGKTALSLAISKNLVDIARMLIVAGATVSETDKQKMQNLSESDRTWYTIIEEHVETNL